MDIDLTFSEKKTFFRFLILYLGSSFILMFFIAFFYYQNEKTLLFDLEKSLMQNELSKISSKIILSHMSNDSFDLKELLKNKKYKISFFDKEKNLILGNLKKEKINFKSKTMVTKDGFILIDDSTLGHLGIYYVALQEATYKEKIDSLFSTTIVIFILTYLIIALIAYYLAKLFLQPIKNERQKLNNFIKDTNHELNTPISALMMSCESKNLNEKQIERIKLSAKRISEIYEDLTYVFLQNKEKKDLSPYKLSELIKEQLEYFIPMANKKRIILDYDLDDSFYSINKDDFIRLINNLLSNAIKYNKLNGRIKIKLKNNTLIIKDTGIGIKKEKMKDIYKRYYRATSLQGGFGLGLNIVHTICQNYNINISLESEENIGTTFTLKF